jgi:hypothetical protein
MDRHASPAHHQQSKSPQMDQLDREKNVAAIARRYLSMTQKGPSLNVISLSLLKTLVVIETAYWMVCVSSCRVRAHTGGRDKVFQLETRCFGTVLRVHKRIYDSDRWMMASDRLFVTLVPHVSLGQEDNLSTRLTDAAAGCCLASYRYYVRAVV